MRKNLNNHALLLIEFQHEWLNENGKLFPLMTDKTSFLESIEHAKKIITAARHIKMPIIHSGLSFQTNYPELGKARYGIRSGIQNREAFLTSSQGSHFFEPFIPQQDEFIVTGRTGSSAFASSNLDSYLRHHQIQTLYMMGYALHVCVESTLRAAHDLGYDAIVIEDASAACTKAQKDHVLNEVVHHFGASIKSDELIELLNRGEKESE